jgi:arginine metabolism regulation protein II
MGLATAQLLATKGAIISLADINSESLNNAVKSLQSSDRHMITAVDVRIGNAVTTWINDTVSKYGKLDGAVNMAGIITHATPVVDTTDDDWDRTFDVNVKGVFNCLRAQLKVMGEGGSIVSTSPCSRIGLTIC